MIIKKPQIFLKKISNVSIFLNIITSALGILYLIMPSPSILYDVFGVFMIFSWSLNLIMLSIIDKYLNKSSAIGKKINRHSYFFIVSFIICLLMMVFGIILTNFILSGFLAILGSLMIISGFFLIVIYGIYYSLLIFTTLSKEGWNFD
ncbi:MAG: hypothetical protein KGD66_09845 [Candidatus Lokiarchaeota archaeon]|nr:hypothetical protein [Candidatus Lokiarchaeota archaeon]